jgi:hypothetical protein
VRPEQQEQQGRRAQHLQIGVRERRLPERHRGVPQREVAGAELRGLPEAHRQVVLADVAEVELAPGDRGREEDQRERDEAGRGDEARSP